MGENENFRDYYDLEKRLGDSKFGLVYKAKNKKTGELRAIKIIDKNKIKKIFLRENLREPTDEEIGLFMKKHFNEIEKMKIFQNKIKENNNIVQYIEFFHTDEELAIVMELCDDNILSPFSKKKDAFSPEEIYDILTQLNNSFKFLEENKIIHKALKLENILIKYENEEKSKFTCKLNLSSHSCLIKDLKDKNAVGHGNSKFMAPEILKGEKFNEKCDLWSLGILIYILSFKEYPYKDKSKEAILNSIKTLGQEKFKETNNSDLNDLIKKLLIEDPEKRITWDEYFKHPFFNKSNGDYSQYYKIIKEIGIGGFSKVYKVVLKNNINEERAIKVINKDLIRAEFMSQNLREMDDEEMKSYENDFDKEINNMKIAEGSNKDNKNSVKYFDFFKNENEMAIVMELCDENLTNLLVKKKNFSIKEIYEILIQLNNTFKIMAKKGLAHRDLKLENILVKYLNKEKTKYIFKITDYGESKLLISLTRKLKTMIGTLNFMAPEIIKGEEYDCECDLWSLGVIIYLLYFRKHPYNGNNDVAILNQIQKQGHNILDTTTDKELDDLIRKLLVEDPKKRITWEGYFNHSFFKKFKNN